MNIFKMLFGFIKKAFSRAGKFGLNDQLISDTLGWVEQAANKFNTSAERREWVVAILVSRGVPESVARLAVEVAVQIWKSKAGK